MSTPYWSSPTRPEADPATRWQQPPNAATAAGNPGEPTVELTGEPGAERTVAFATGALQPHSPTESWPRSAVTAPLPPEADPTPYRGVDALQQHPAPQHPGHASSYPVQPETIQHHPAQYQNHPVQNDPVPPYPVQDYPVQNYPVPYYPMAGQPVLWSDRSKAAAAVLAFFLGPLGVHNFYLGHVGRGVVQLLLTLTGVGLVLSWIWVVIEFVLILTGGLRDRYGRLLR